MIAINPQFRRTDRGLKSFIGIGDLRDRSNFRQLISRVGNFDLNDDTVDDADESYVMYDPEFSQLNIAFLLDEGFEEYNHNTGLIIIGEDYQEIDKTLHEYLAKTGIGLVVPGKLLETSLRTDGLILYTGYQEGAFKWNYKY